MTTRPKIYFDYDHQAWIKDGIVQRCEHPETMDCDCYGREHAGERTLHAED